MKYHQKNKINHKEGQLLKQSKYKTTKYIYFSGKAKENSENSKKDE